MKDVIINAVKEVTGVDQIELSVPENPEHGDYTTNVVLRISSHGSSALSTALRADPVTSGSTTKDASSAKSSKSNPRDMANEIVNKLKENKELAKIVGKIEVAGSGFINFWISKDRLVDNLIYITDQKEEYGKTDLNKGKTVIVEYSSPNIAKPFTIGHLRSTIIGDAIANILVATGWNVLRDNHLGDWGTQFGKQIYAIKVWGDEAEISKSENPVKELVALYVKFHEEAEKDPTLEEKAREWFKKLEDGDKEARQLWQKCVDWSWKEFDRIYEILGVQFSKEFDNGRGLGESFFEDKMQSVIEELENKGLLKEGKEGAKLVFFENDKYSPAMILKKDGATLYHTRDLATDKYRKIQFDPELIINEVGAEQELYFKQLFEMEKMLGWYTDDQRVHIAHGLIRFKEGKMSTRKGNIIWLDDVLYNAMNKAMVIMVGKHYFKTTPTNTTGVENIEIIERKNNSQHTLKTDKIKEIAWSIGIGAIKWNDLKRDPRQNVVFDWDDILNMSGFSGPYVQYTYARAKSILEKAKSHKTDVKVDAIDEEEQKILRRLAQYSGAIEDAAKLYSPNTLCLYLYELAREFNGFYNKNKIIGSENEEFRLLLTAGVAQVLKNGLYLLGIETPEKM